MSSVKVDNEELLAEVEDVAAKLSDIMEHLQTGKDLDLTQMSFLEMHNIA